MSKQRHPLVVWLIVGAGLMGLGYWTYTTFRAPSGSAQPVAAGQAGAAAKPGAGAVVNAGAAAPGPGAFALPVETARVAATNLSLDATAVGSLRSNESVILRPETSGRISLINFKDGSRVAKGTLLIALDAAMQQAEYDQAKANLGLAQVNLKRSRELFEKKFVSQQALDNVEAAVKVQDATLALAQAKLDKTQIKAPFAGVVGIRNVSVGDYVKEGQELINLEDIGTLKIDFRLPESALGQLKSGQTVEVTTDALPQRKFVATLDAINPLVDTGGRSISCLAHLSNAENLLRPGMFVRVRLIFEERRDVLMLPEQAIVPDPNAAFVFRVSDGKAERVVVRTGLRKNAQVEVVEGLKAGDEIVIAGQMKLRDGAPVSPINPPAAAAPGSPATSAAGPAR